MEEKKENPQMSQLEKEDATGTSNNIPALSSKHNYKVSPAAARAIVDLTLQGATSREIIKFLKDQFGISLKENSITRYRRKYRQRMLAAWEDEIAAARAAYPDSALLVGRLGTLDKAIKIELKKKKKMNSIAVAELVGTADTAIYHAEMLRLRMSESERKYPSRADDAHEQVMRELERRSHVYRDVTERAEKARPLLKENMDMDDEVVVQAEIIQDNDESKNTKQDQRPADKKTLKDVIGKAMTGE